MANCDITIGAATSNYAIVDAICYFSDHLLDTYSHDQAEMEGQIYIQCSMNQRLRASILTRNYVLSHPIGRIK